LSRLKPKPKPGEDTKNKIKDAEDILELLQREEVDSLTLTTNRLHEQLHSNNIQSTLGCGACGHINPEKSLFAITLDIQ